MTTADRVIILDGSAEAGREVLGGKAFSVNRMRALGLPLPPAFALPTSECARFHEGGDTIDSALWDEIVASMRTLEAETGRTFGRGPSPLLVSARSGAAESMPGMMDTVLNLGITPELTAVLARESRDPDWAGDTWQRFRDSYRSIVLGVEADQQGEPPADSWEQLRAAIGAIFGSWESSRAVAYRQRHRLNDLAGTSVTIQAMVFGNRDPKSGTGVLFSRDPSTGEPGVRGEWLAQAQGEEVVSGIRTPSHFDVLTEQQPDAAARLLGFSQLLENDIHDLVDMEFTIESGTLYILQSRSGKRTPRAAVRIAVEMANEGVISRQEAIGRISAEQASRLAESLAEDTSAELLAEGTGIGTGVGAGLAVFDVIEAERRVDAGEPIVLVRNTTSPEDVPAMFLARAVITAVGGSTSHAALVCREIGMPCVVGAGTHVIEKLVGRFVTVDGTTGRITAGTSKDEHTIVDPYLLELLSWVEGPVSSDHPLWPLLDR